MDTAPSKRDMKAAETLAHSRIQVLPALRTAVDRLTGTSRAVAGFHFGWWDADGRPEDGPGGKTLRPALVLASAAAAGGRPADAIGAAVAVELLHNATLLHDDVIDRDPSRRHRPTAWTVFGKPAAILTGDALQALAFDCLAAEPGYGLRGIRMLHAATQELLDGQQEDTAAERRTGVSTDEALRIAEAKTAALLGVCCGLGGLAAGTTDAGIARLTSFGRRLGQAFQIVDDALGIWGDPAVTGKPAWSDLRARKKSAPVTVALHAGGPASRELGRLYGCERLTEAELGRCADLIAAAGARDWCRERSTALLGEALRDLGTLKDSTLESLARFVVERNH